MSAWHLLFWQSLREGGSGSSLSEPLSADRDDERASSLRRRGAARAGERVLPRCREGSLSTWRTTASTSASSPQTDTATRLSSTATDGWSADEGPLDGRGS